MMHTGTSHAHSRKRREEGGEAGAGAGCMPSSVAPCSYNPMVPCSGSARHSSQPSSINNTYFAETSVARKAECWPEQRKGVTGSLWGGQISALQSKQALPLSGETWQVREMEAAGGLGPDRLFLQLPAHSGTRGKCPSLLGDTVLCHSRY